MVLWREDVIYDRDGQYRHVVPGNRNIIPRVMRSVLFLNTVKQQAGNTILVPINNLSYNNIGIYKPSFLHFVILLR